jgi:SOS response regulatory protein OraA/RecX
MTQAKTARLDGAALREAALAYVTRYGGTEAALARALDRRIRRWADALASVEGCDRTAIAGQAVGLREAAAKVVADLVAMGAVNDQAFAESRARRLRRAGRSRRAVLAHLAARGVAGETAGEAVPEDTATEFTRFRPPPARRSLRGHRTGRRSRCRSGDPNPHGLRPGGLQRQHCTPGVGL